MQARTIRTLVVIARARFRGSRRARASAKSFRESVEIRICSQNSNLWGTPAKISPEFENRKSKISTMALFDQIKHEICPAFMKDDRLFKSISVKDGFFVEKGCNGK